MIRRYKSVQRERRRYRKTRRVRYAKRAAAFYKSLDRYVDNFMKKLERDDLDKVSKKEMRKLRRKIRRAKRLMRKRRAFRYKKSIRYAQRLYGRSRRYKRRNRHKRSRRYYDLALKRINRIIKKIRRIKRRRKIRNARLSSDPRSDKRERFTFYYTKDLDGYRNRYDRIRRRQRADYTFNVRIPRRADIYRAYIRLRAKPKNNRDFKLRIKVNGKRVFQDEIKRLRAGRFRYKTIKIDKDVLRRGKNRVRLVIIRPFRNFYLDIDKLYLRVYARNR